MKQIWAFSLLAVLISAPAFARGGRLVSPYFLVAGGDHDCASDENGVKCWGTNQYGESKAPALKNLISLSAGSNHTCAIDSDGLHCWGWNQFGQAFAPNLKNPTLVTAGNEHTCAQYEDGIFCWGNNENHQIDVPRLKNPGMISAGWKHTCALDDDGAKCWGQVYDGEVPALKNPVSVSAGGMVSDGMATAPFTCALDEDGVKCWGITFHAKVPELTKPVMVSAGGGNGKDAHACALDREGVKCWGSDKAGQIKVPPLNHPRSVVAGNTHTCALDDEGVKCWGLWGNFQAPVPGMSFSFASLEDPAFDLDDFSGYLLIAAKVTIVPRGRLLLSLGQFLADNFAYTDKSREASVSRYFMAKLLGAAVRSDDSPFAQKKLIPAFDNGMQSFERELGMSDIAAVPHTRQNRRIALEATRSAASILADFLNLQDREALQPLLRALGQAMVDPLNLGKTQAVLQAKSDADPILQKLSKGSKSDFLVQVLVSATDWLKQGETIL